MKKIEIRVNAKEKSGNISKTITTEISDELLIELQRKDMKFVQNSLVSMVRPFFPNASAITINGFRKI